MKEKRSIVITFRTDEKTKEKLDKMSQEREWSVSQVVEKICREYFTLKEEKNHEQPDSNI